MRDSEGIRERKKNRLRKRIARGENAVGLKRSQGERRMIVSMITMERGRDEKEWRERWSGNARRTVANGGMRSNLLALT